MYKVWLLLSYSLKGFFFISSNCWLAQNNWALMVLPGVWKSWNPESGIGTGIGTGTGTGTGIGTGMGRETYIKAGTTFTLIL